MHLSLWLCGKLLIQLSLINSSIHALNVLVVGMIQIIHTMVVKNRGIHGSRLPLESENVNMRNARSILHQTNRDAAIKESAYTGLGSTMMRNDKIMHISIF